jgi:hypothetical protein
MKNYTVSLASMHVCQQNSLTEDIRANCVLS